MNSNISIDRTFLLSCDYSILLHYCDQSFFIATGNGGQHRNKTMSAVRLSLKNFPEITVIDCHSRHREQNRQSAIFKLRLKLAYKIRMPSTQFSVLPFPNIQHPNYPLWLANLIDILEENLFSTADSAKQMQISTGKLIKLLKRDPTLWEWVNQSRIQKNLYSLK